MKARRFQMEVTQNQRNRHQETQFSEHLTMCSFMASVVGFLPQYTLWEFEPLPPNFSLGLRAQLNYFIVIGIFNCIKPSSICTTFIYFFWRNKGAKQRKTKAQKELSPSVYTDDSYFSKPHRSSITFVYLRQSLS